MLHKVIWSRLVEDGDELFVRAVATCPVCDGEAEEYVGMFDDCRRCDNTGAIEGKLVCEERNCPCAGTGWEHVCSCGEREGCTFQIPCDSTERNRSMEDVSEDTIRTWGAAENPLSYYAPLEFVEVPTPAFAI